jgi:hypothetical protein
MQRPHLMHLSACDGIHRRTLLAAMHPTGHFLALSPHLRHRSGMMEYSEAFTNRTFAFFVDDLHSYSSGNNAASTDRIGRNLPKGHQRRLFSASANSLQFNRILLEHPLRLLSSRESQACAGADPAHRTFAEDHHR